MIFTGLSIVNATESNDEIILNSDMASDDLPISENVFSEEIDINQDNLGNGVNDNLNHICSNSDISVYADGGDDDSNIGNYSELRYLTQNADSTLILEKDYEFSYPSESGIKIYNNLTINGDGHYINTQGLSRIFNIDGITLTLNNIKFIASQSANGIDYSSIDLEGGAIFAINSNLIIENCSFFSFNSNFGGAICVLNTNLTFHNVSIANCSANYYGGAVYQMYGNLFASSSSFANCTAIDGAGLFADDLDNVYLTDTDFYNNHAYLLGGAIFSNEIGNLEIEECSFELNNAAYDNKSYVDLNGDAHVLNYYGENLVDGSDYNGYDVYNQAKYDLYVFYDNDYELFYNNGTIISEFPEIYDLRDDGFVTEVKNQGSGGNCWSFSAIAALESAILKATNGAVSLDLSEENMKNLMACFSPFGTTYETNTGGNDRLSNAYLTAGLGPVLESLDNYVYNDYISAIFNPLTHIQNILWIDRNNYTDNFGIKYALLNYGAVSVSCYFSSSHANGPNYYYTGTNGRNHAVTIVGWNDTYSASKFKNAPPGDGAWIVKNNWGTSSGNDGYYYVSYYDTRFAIGHQECFCFVLNNSVKYEKTYQYDIVGMSDWLYNENASKGIWYKNVFNSTGDEVLAAFSTYFNEKTNYTAYVYVNGELVNVQEGSAHNGYCTIKLSKYIFLKKGDKFEIVLNVRSDDISIIPISESSSSKRDYALEGVSFFSFDGESWEDLYNYSGEYYENGNRTHWYNSSMVACLKAFSIQNLIPTTVAALKINDVIYELGSIIELPAGRDFNMTALVYDEFGDLVNLGEIKFVINGSEYIINSNSNLGNPFDSSGLYELAINFDGANVYNNCSNLAQLYYNSSGVDLEFVVVNDTGKFVINVFDEHDNLVNEGSVLVNITGDDYYKFNIYNLTDNELVLDLDSTVNNGIYTIFVRYIDGEGFVSSEIRKSFIVDFKENSVINVSLVNKEFLIFLSDSDGNPIKGAAIDYYLDGLWVANTIMTDDDGKVYLSGIRGAGHILFVFTANETYNGVQAYEDYLIPFDTVIYSDNHNIMAYPNYGYFNLTLKDENNNVLRQKVVNCLINGITMNVRTDENGVATFTFALNTVGTYNANVSFEGDNITYDSTSSIFNITVNKVNVTISSCLDNDESNEFEVENEKNMTLKVETQKMEIWDSEIESFFNISYPLVKKELVLVFADIDSELDDETVFDSDEYEKFYGVTDENGLVNFNIDANRPGNYKYLVMFAGDNEYNPCLYEGQFAIYSEKIYSGVAAIEVVNGTKDYAGKVILDFSEIYDEEYSICSEDMHLFINEGSIEGDFPYISYWEYYYDKIVFNIPELDIGTYNFTIYYGGNDYYGAHTFNGTYYVTKIPLGVYIYSNPVKECENGTVYIYLYDDIENAIEDDLPLDFDIEDAVIIVNDVEYKFNVSSHTFMDKGVEINIGQLPAGNYDISFRFAGDENYMEVKEFIAEEPFSVISKDNKANISWVNIYNIIEAFVGYNCTISFEISPKVSDLTLNADFKIILIDSDGTEFEYLTSVNEDGEGSIDLGWNLTAGNYTLKVQYLGNDYYNPTEILEKGEYSADDFTTLNIYGENNKKIVYMYLDYNNPLKGENTTFNIYLAEYVNIPYSGKVKILLTNPEDEEELIEYIVDIDENGNGSLDLGYNLTNNLYYVSAEYVDDPFYSSEIEYGNLYLYSEEYKAWIYINEHYCNIKSTFKDKNGTITINFTDVIEKNIPLDGKLTVLLKEVNGRESFEYVLIIVDNIATIDLGYNFTYNNYDLIVTAIDSTFYDYYYDSEYSEPLSRFHVYDEDNGAPVESIKIDMKDALEGQNTTLFIDLSDSKLSDVSLNGDIKIRLIDFEGNEYEYIAIIDENGKGSIDLGYNLTYGEYLVKVQYLGNDCYEMSYEELDYLNIYSENNKAYIDSCLNYTFNNISEGLNTTILLDLSPYRISDSSMEGTINITLIDIENNIKFYYLNDYLVDVNGECTIELGDNLPIGKYYFLINYSGNNIYSPSEFELEKIVKIDEFEWDLCWVYIYVVENTIISYDYDVSASEIVLTNIKQGKNFLNNIDVKFEIFDSNNNLLSNDTAIILNGNSQYSLNLSPGNYTVRITILDNVTVYSFSVNKPNWFIGDKEFSSLEKAIEAANDGDIIEGLEGTYQLNSPVIINKNITIAAKDGRILFDGGEGPLFIIESYDEENYDFIDLSVTFKNITFANIQNGDVELAYTIEASFTNLTLYGCKFENNSIDNDEFNGLIHVNWGALNIYNSSFINNEVNFEEADRVYGIINVENSDVNIENSYFSNCSAGTGGALYISGGSIKIDNSTFDDCSAGTGGAIAISGVSGGSYVISNTTFIDCDSNNEGSALYVTSSDGTEVVVTLYDDVVYENCGSDAVYVSDDVTIETISTIEPILTKITYDPINSITSVVINGENTQGNILNVILTDLEGNLLSNKEIKLIVGGDEFINYTNNEGIAQIPIALSYDTTTSFKLVFDGDNEYAACDIDGIINVSKIDAVFITNDLVINAYPNTGVFTFTLKDMYGKALADKIVTITFNGKTYKRITDESGFGSLEINENISSQYVITGSFAGDDIYRNASFSSYVTVSKNNVTINVQNYEFDIDDNKEINITLKTSNGLILAGKELSLIINGFTYTKTTNLNGIATFMIDLDSVGNYTYEVNFNGDEGANGESSSGIITITGELPLVETVMTFDKITSLTTVLIDGESTLGNILNIHLKDINGVNLVNKPVNIVFGDENHIAYTNYAGVAQIPIALTYGVPLSFEVYFVDDDYADSSIEGVIYVPMITSFSTTSPSISAYPNSGFFTFTLKDVKGNPLFGKTVTYYFNGKQYNATTNINGQVIFKISISKAANYTITGKFVGDSQYAGSSFTKIIKVSKNSVKFTSPTKKVKKSKARKAPFKVTLKTSNNKLLAKKLVYIKINKKTYKIKTNAKGVASFKLKLPKVKKTYKYKLTFKGDASNNKKTYSGSLKVY